MKIQYIAHSGFMLSGSEHVIIIDYYKGDLPQFDPSLDVLVLASHFHADHYQPVIFDILRQRGVEKITAVLAKDIKPSKYPPKMPGLEIIKAYAGKVYQPVRGVTVETLLSTDSGVAFVITVDGLTLYHAGDLNDWAGESMSEQERKQMRGSYRHEIDKLKGRRIDCAFVPLDPGLGDGYAEGMRFLLETADVRRVLPMHYWDDPSVIERFCSEYAQYADKVINTEKREDLII